MMKRFVVVALAALAITVAHVPAADAGLKLYAMAAYVAPLSETDQNVGGVTDAVKASSEFGFSFGGEFRFTSLMGLEFDYLYAKHDIEGDNAGLLGTTTFQPISATLNFHLPLPVADIYAGPTASYVNWGDLEINGSSPTSIDAEFGYGVSAGVDIPLLPAVSATGGLRWLNVKADPEGSADPIDVHPLFARVGAAVRF